MVRVPVKIPSLSNLVSRHGLHLTGLGAIPVVESAREKVRPVKLCAFKGQLHTFVRTVLALLIVTEQAAV